MAAFRALALLTAILATARIVYYRMLGWNQELQGWPEICAAPGGSARHRAAGLDPAVGA